MTDDDARDWTIVKDWLAAHATEPGAFADQPAEVREAAARIQARHPELT